MKILYLHQYFRTPYENGGIRSYLLAKELVNAGHSVVVVTSDNSLQQNSTIEELEGFTLIKYRVNYSQNMSSTRRIIAFVNFILKSSVYVLKNRDVDLVLATSTPLTVGVLALLKKKIQGIPYVFEVRDVWPEAAIAIGAIKNPFLIKLLVKFESIIYRNARAIVPLSTGMKESILNRFPHLTCPIQVIPNISDINSFNCLGNVNEKSIIQDLIGYRPQLSILYAGSFGKVNGLLYVVDLAENLLERLPQLVFLLVGDGSQRNEIIEYAKFKGVLNENLYILDPLSKNKLPALYAEVTFGSSFVLPIEELWRNSANKYFDTLASGKPIIINYLGWQYEEIHKNEIGFTLPPHFDEHSLKVFEDYLNDYDKISKHGSNAYDVARRYYSLEVFVSKYLDILSLTQAG